VTKFSHNLKSMYKIYILISFTELSNKTCPLHKVVTSFKNYYSEIYSDNLKCKSNQIKNLDVWKKFKVACDEDMQV